MKSIKILVAITVLLSFTISNAQIKNTVTKNFKIYGNCEMCKGTIEKAANIKKVAHVEWNKNTKMATLTYDAGKTNHDEILKRIALAGYDSDSFLAPDDRYAKLPECCQYNRVKKSKTAKIETTKAHTRHNHEAMTDKTTATKQETNQLKAIFDNYFALKDAMVQSDGPMASAKAKALLIAIKGVKMGELAPEEHMVWMKINEDLASDAERIEASKDAGFQRNHFSTLSDNIYQLLKVSKQETPIYYQHCPMAKEGQGAHWLSKEHIIKNPYYGLQMLTCGKTVETIK